MSADRKPRPVLKLATKPQGPSFAMVKRALRLFRADWIPKAQRHRNARAWLVANARLGESHLLKGGVHKCGRPGAVVDESEIHAPRRYGAK